MTERRQQLIDAAVQVFAERGFRGATTRRIAAVAGVTEAVIFQHFRDKDGLYAAILEQKADDPRMERWLAELGRPGQDDYAVIRTLVSGIVARHELDPHLLRLMVYSALEHHPLATRLHAQGRRLYHVLEEFIATGQRAGRFRAGPPAVLVRAVLALPIYYLLQRQLFRTPWPSATTSDLIDLGVQFTLAGLAAPPVTQEEGR